MTAHPEQDRAEFEEWARKYGTWEVVRADDPALEITGYTDLTLTVAWHAAQAVRLAPAVAVPQGWKLVPEVATDEMEVAAENDYEQTNPYFPNWKTAYAAMLAAAPELPEVNMGESHIQRAAPVQLPELDFDTASHTGSRIRGYRAETVQQLLTAQKFQLDELAMLTRKLVQALRKAAPDNKTAAKAVDYLKRKGLQGNPLRALGKQEQTHGQ